MPFVFVVLIILMICFMAAFCFISGACTEIGAKGKRNVLLKSVCLTAVSLLAILFGLMQIAYSTPGGVAGAVGAMATGAAVFVCAVVWGRGIMRENPDDIVTEKLSGVHVSPAGYHNRERMLRGMTNGRETGFLFRGADRKIAEDIGRSRKMEVVITYHRSDRRIESLSVIDNGGNEKC